MVTALAAEFGVSRKHLSNVLNGHAPVTMPLLQRLGAALSVEPELLACLLNQSPKPRPDPYGFMPGWIVAHGDLTEPMEVRRDPPHAGHGQPPHRSRRWSRTRESAPAAPVADP